VPDIGCDAGKRGEIMRNTLPVAIVIKVSIEEFFVG